MSVLYLVTSPAPPVPGTDAVFQEVNTLRKAFGGEVLNLCPRKVPGAPCPAKLYGFHALPSLWRLQDKCDLIHLYHSIPYFFPVLHLLRKRIVFTVVAGLGQRRKPRHLTGLRSLSRLVVSNPRDAAVLQSWGLSNHVIVPPGLETGHLTKHALSVERGVTLLVASAPWVEEQFDSKGIDVLLDAAAQQRDLKLILIWRGVLLDELTSRVRRRGIESQVEIVTERVNVGDYLKRAHAAVLLPKRGDIVKAFPHSLIEGLMAGKPVILSDVLPMADYVRERGCGIVVRDIDCEHLVGAIGELRRRYAGLAEQATRIPPSAFSTDVLVDRYREIYEL